MPRAPMLVPVQALPPTNPPPELMSPALIEALLDVQRRAQAAGHGGKEAIYAAACQHLGMSRATLMRRLKEVAVKP